VAAGDTLTKIAKAFSTETDKVTANDIFEMNRDVISDPNLIHPGQILRIPFGAGWTH
jgi:nucleoid-associated protein YgaU